VQKTQRTAEGCHIFLTRVNPVLPINANDLKNEDPDPILSSKRGDLLPEGDECHNESCVCTWLEMVNNLPDECHNESCEAFTRSIEGKHASYFLYTAPSIFSSTGSGA
jgi:hypothetical protein